MKARYINTSEKDQVPGCEICVTSPDYPRYSSYDGWHIRVMRSGGKPDFVICSNCGNLITKIGALDQIYLDNHTYKKIRVRLFSDDPKTF